MMIDGFPDDAHSVTLLSNRLRQDLRVAMKARDTITVATLRMILAAIDHAGAVVQTADHRPTVGRSGDVARRLLSLEDLEAILSHERGERERAMGEYSRVGRTEEVAKLQQEVRIITRYLAGSD